MATSTIVLIAIAAVAAILFVVLLARLVRDKRNEHRHTEADKIREDARQETLHVKQQEALANETAAKARAAQAEADVKAAQASGLRQQAAVHLGEATTSRGQLNEQWDRADTMDPATSTPETPRLQDHRETPGSMTVSK